MYRSRLPTDCVKNLRVPYKQSSSRYERVRAPVPSHCCHTTIRQHTLHVSSHLIEAKQPSELALEPYQSLGHWYLRRHRQSGPAPAISLCFAVKKTHGDVTMEAASTHPRQSYPSSPPLLVETQAPCISDHEDVAGVHSAGSTDGDATAVNPVKNHSLVT